MFLNSDFCMEKYCYQGKSLFSRKKNKNFNILLKYKKKKKKKKKHQIVRKSLLVVQTVEKSRQICQNPKLKILGLSPLPMQNLYS